MSNKYNQRPTYRISSFESDLVLFYVFTEKICVLTVGNKDDDPSRKVVNPHDARAFASQMGIDLFETSAKENKNVEEVSQVNPFVVFLYSHLVLR